MKITIGWGKGKPARTPKVKGRPGKGDRTCGCGAPLPKGVRACGRCARSMAADHARAAKAGKGSALGTHQCPDGKTRTTRQGHCPGPFC